MKVVCILLALVLADLTYRLIEKPIRFDVAGRTLKTVITSSAMVATAIVAFILGESEGIPSRFPAEVQKSLQDYSKETKEAYGKDCLINVGERFGNCGQDTGGKKKILVWGDSLAAQLVPGLKKLAQKQDLDVIQFTVSACPPLFAFALTSHHKDCSSAFETVAEKIAELNPDTVVMVGYWQIVYYALNTKQVDEAIHQTVGRLKAMGIRRVVGVGQFPHWRSPVQLILSRAHNPLGRFLNMEPVELQNSKYLDRLNDSHLREVFTTAGATFISPKATLCNESGCQLLVPRNQDMPMVFDTHHLTVAGSIYFAAANERALLGD
jgi:SGNH domain (fused to AT3 domains)